MLQGLGTDPISPSSDKRAKTALVGAIFGGGLPIGILLLIGLLDSRYRYSDETDDSGMAGLALLGILPNLPDRLTDPAQTPFRVANFDWDLSADGTNLVFVSADTKRLANLSLPKGLASSGLVVVSP